MKKRSLIEVFGVVGFIILGFTLIFISNTSYSQNEAEGSTITVTAEGTAEWFYVDTHGEDHGLDEGRFGTPQDPKATDILPIENRVVSRDGTFFSGIKESAFFSLTRATVDGKIWLTATDITPLDTVESWDRASLEAEFDSPLGDRFKVVLKELAPGTLPFQTFGGVMFNHMIHGGGGTGSPMVGGAFSYETIRGYGDIYKNGELAVEGAYIHATTAQNGAIQNRDKAEGRYNLDKPVGKVVVHLVILPINKNDEPLQFPTGVYDHHGMEQNFFHINFPENISSEGNHFLENLGH